MTHNLSQKYKWRFTIFKKELLKEFDAQSVYDVVLPFTQRKKGLFSLAFGAAFGTFKEEHAEVVARGFAERIEIGARIEESTNSVS